MILSEHKMGKKKKASKPKKEQKKQKQSAKPRLPKGTPLSTVYWGIFIVSVAVWCGVFWFTFSEYHSYTEKVSKHLMDSGTSAEKDVLGTEDGTEDGAEEEGGESLSEEEAAEAVDDLEEDVGAVVDQIEEERKETLRKVILLQVPSEIDNPNYAITFVEPTEEGVEIQVDGDGFSKKKSPYVLPSLAIGAHVINFRFEDDEEVVQNLEETFVVIPRAPIWAEDQSTEFRSDDEVVLVGTSLPRSTVVILVSSEMITEEIEVDEEGNWEVTISDDIETGEHTAISFVRKDGYASQFSEPLMFTVGQVEGASSNGEEGEEENSASKPKDTTSWYDNEYINEGNYYYVIGGAGLVFIIIVLVIALISHTISKRKARGAGWVEKEANHDSPPAESEVGKVSLREKFARAGLNVQPVKKSEAPTQAQDVPTQKPEVPDQKQDVPAQKPEVPDQKQGAPAQKPEAPTQTQDAPTQKPEVPGHKQDVPAQKPDASAQKTEAEEKAPEAKKSTEGEKVVADKKTAQSEKKVEESVPDTAKEPIPEAAIKTEEPVTKKPVTEEAPKEEKKEKESDTDPGKKPEKDPEKKPEKDPGKKPEKKPGKKSEKKPEKGKVYSKDEFMKTFPDGDGGVSKQSNKIKISLTSQVTDADPENK